jgi:hypothetical protein
MDMDSLLLKPLRKRRNAMSLSDLHRYGLDKS